MATIEDLLLKLAPRLDASVNYADKLRLNGYRTPVDIQEAESAETLGKHCTLLPGDAWRIYKAAGGGVRWAADHTTSAQLSLHCSPLACPVMTAPRCSSTVLACIGQLRLSMERWQRTRCSLPGASQQQAPGRVTPGHACTDPCRPSRACAAAAPRSRPSPQLSELPLSQRRAAACFCKNRQPASTALDTVPGFQSPAWRCDFCMNSYVYPMSVFPGCSWPLGCCVPAAVRVAFVVEAVGSLLLPVRTGSLQALLWIQCLGFQALHGNMTLVVIVAC